MAQSSSKSKARVSACAGGQSSKCPGCKKEKGSVECGSELCSKASTRSTKKAKKD